MSMFARILLVAKNATIKKDKIPVLKNIKAFRIS